MLSERQSNFKWISSSFVNFNLYSKEFVTTGYFYRIWILYVEYENIYNENELD